MSAIANGQTRQIVLMCCCVALFGGCASIPLESFDDETGFVPIFNGKNLDGWTGDTSTYFAEDGMLQCRQKGKFGGGHLRTEKSYENFILRFEFRLPPEANNGVAIRCAPTARAATEGMEIQLLDDTAPLYWRDLKLGSYQYTGSIYGVVAARRKPGFEGPDAPAKSTYLNPVGTWNEMQVRAEGEHITVHLNREKVVDADMTQWSGYYDTPDHKMHSGIHTLCGRIGWCGHGYNVQWRNIRVKELPPSPLRIDGRWAFDAGGRGAWLCLDGLEKTGEVQLLLMGGCPAPAKPVRNTDGTYVIVRGRSRLMFKPTNAEYMDVTFIQEDGKPEKIVARRIPTLGRIPQLATFEYGEPIDLLKDGLEGWEPKEEGGRNCWTFRDGVLENSGGSAGLITKRRDFEDFKLSFDVRVDKGGESGAYLRGIYELQVADTCGKPASCRSMAALYGRLAPKISAEKPAGEWQHVEAVLCDRHLTVTLNDERIIDKERIYGITGGAITADEFVPGPMCLLCEHGGVAYRNMVLTPIINKGLR